MNEATPSSQEAAPSYYPPSQTPTEKKGAGCILWGCVIAVILVVGGMTAVVGGGYYMFAKVRDNYTDTQPMALPQTTLSEEERKDVKDRFEAFHDALDDGTAIDPFVLNEDEINVLIAENDSDDSMNDALRVEIEDDVLKGQLSLPLDDFPFPGMKGRFFNGTAELRASFKDGELEVYIENASVKGEPLPDSFMDELRSENFAQNFMSNPDTRKTLRKIESIEIHDGQVTIVPKTGETSGTLTDSEAPASMDEALESVESSP